MNLTEYIRSHCQETLEKNGFELKTHVEKASFGNELIRFENSFLVIEFVRDRDHETMHFLSKITREKHHRYSIELLRQLLTNEDDYHPSLDEINGSFLKVNLSEVISLFETSKFEETRKVLSRLERKRAKRLFG